MVSNGLIVIISRNDVDHEEDNAFKCLYDKSCVLAHLSQKNEMKIDAVLTSGEYKITFFDQQNSEVRRFLTDECGMQ